MDNYYIYTGPVKTGKSTRLLEYAGKVPEVEGILQIVQNGKRCLFDIKSKQMRQLEVEINSASETIQIGTYIFNKEVLDWGSESLINSFNNNVKTIIVDEIGHLELQDAGIAPAIEYILNNPNGKSKIIFVVRDNLVNKFFEKYKLNREKIQFFEINN